MQKDGEIFTIVYNGQQIKVQPYTYQNRSLFAIGLPNKQLIILKSEKLDGTEFWTSMPQGEQKLAEHIGKLIDDKFNTKQQTLF